MTFMTSTFQYQQPYQDQGVMPMVPLLLVLIQLLCSILLQEDPLLCILMQAQGMFCILIDFHQNGSLQIVTQQIIDMRKIRILNHYTEASSDGFKTAVQPAARAGAIFQVAINNG